MNHSVHTVALFGLPISNVTLEDALSRLQQYILSGETHQVAFANLTFARNSLRDHYLQRLLCDCSMVLPDGAPIVWASHIVGAPLTEPVTAAQLIPMLARLAASRGFGIYLLGASEAVSAKAALHLERTCPGLRIVGRHCPEIGPLHEMENEEVLHRIEQAQPDILFVAFGTPRQEIWIHRFRDRLAVPLVIGVGSALDALAGEASPRASWERELRMDRSLLPGYAGDVLTLLLHLPLGLAARSLQPGERRQGKLQCDVEGTVRIVKTPSKLCGEISRELAFEARAAALASQTLVIDLSGTLRVEADGLGALLEARRILLGEGLWIWLTGMSNPVRRVLQFSALADLFRLAPATSEAIRFTLRASSLASAGGRHLASTQSGLRATAPKVTKASIAKAS